MPPETRYARSGDINIGYQIVGRGGHDLVLGLGWFSHLDAFWEETRFARFVELLSSFARVVLYDKRGTGLSDAFPLDQPQSLESRIEDLAAVITAAGCQRPALVDCSTGSAIATAFAAAKPDLVSTLIVIGGDAGRLLPGGSWDRDGGDELLEINPWGIWANAGAVFPSVESDERFTRWWSSYVRRCVRPGMARALTRFNAGLDVAAQLGRIAAPTLYLHAAGDRIVPLEHGRFLAAHTPGARLVALPGEDHLPFLSGSDHALAEIERMVTGSIRHAQADSGLSAVLATEICNAAEFALRAGDRAWSELRWQQSTLVESAVKRHSGQEVASPLDGSVALFRRPSDAAACARAIIDGTAALGLHARAGVHMGEIVRAGGMTAGVALHLATWVMQLARAGEVLASGPAFDLMPGTSGRFELAGTQVFPGLPGEWRIYRQVRDGTDGSGTEVTGGAGTSQPLAVLSRREREIAALLALGLANRQIADELTISLGTVERHVANILVKLGYRSRSQVAAWAAEHGLSRPSETAEAAP